MTRLPNALRLALALGAGGLAACASSPNPALPPSYMEGTVLDRNAIEVVKRTEFLEVGIEPDASELSSVDRRRIESFVRAFQDTGQGQLIVSLPASSANPQLAVAATAAARTIAWEVGVKYEEIAGTTHGANSDVSEPLILAYQTYEAIAPKCKTFAETDIADASSNNEMEMLGCATRTNLAAMIADPSDLLGQRPLDAGDPVRRATILAKFRNGETTASARGDEDSGVISDAVRE